jgi:hypothetical protein
MLDQALIALVVETAGQPARQTQAGVNLPQQRRATVAGKRATRKIDHDFSPSKILKLERSLLTVC